MAKRKRKTASKRNIEQYGHPDKQRANNPPVGLVTSATDGEDGQKEYQYDPHLDPQLQWAGKAERTSFTVPTRSLHVHERIDPRTIIAAVQKQNGAAEGQMSLFEAPEAKLPLRDAVEFYKHPHGWTNRLVAGDSLLVMNSLLEKEGMAGKVQMVYFDPPYGIKYGSNFQPFVNKRDVKDGQDADLTQEPEMIRAFRDTWELGIHSYLSYMRDRLLLAKDLLHESGSIFVQISDENLHHVREIMDEVFGVENYCAQILFAKSGGTTRSFLSSPNDYLVWYARDLRLMKYRSLFRPKNQNFSKQSPYSLIRTQDGTRRKLTESEKLNPDKIGQNSKIYRLDNLTSQGFRKNTTIAFEFNEKQYHPGNERNWKTTLDGLEKLKLAERLEATTGLYYVRFFDDFPVSPFSNNWTDTGIAGFASDKKYVVETSTKVAQRCLLMTTDPGDLILDITCGSGTTAYAAEQWGRRWITCDTSRIAITLAKQRLMTALFDYYELADAGNGIAGGFRYKTVPHITLKSIANNPEIREGMSRAEIDAAIARHAPQETLYDQPYTDKGKARVSGPFTVEAVPAPVVKPLLQITNSDTPADNAVARSGESLRQDEWRGELLKTGIRAKGGAQIRFVRVEPLATFRSLHAEAETDDDARQRAVISFGPQHAPLEQRQVERALEEARRMVPPPHLLIFAAFQFDPEAAKDIDETEWPGITMLKAQMNTDLLTEDLKKKRSNNQSFWLIGQPEVELSKIGDGPDAGKYRAEVLGFDYYNPVNGKLDSGGPKNIAMWMLDTDYDGRSIYPRQVFFPMAGAKDGWARLAKNLKAEIDEELIEAYRGTQSLPFSAGDYGRIAVKIVDDRGIESLRIIDLK